MLSMIRGAALACVLLASTGCLFASVGGEVDGDSVPLLISSAFMDADVGDGALAAAQYISTGDACGFNAAYYDIDLEDDDAPDEVADVYEERGLNDFWSVKVTLVAADEDDLDGLDQEEIKLDDFDDVSALFFVCHNNDLPDVDEDNDVKSLDMDEDCYVGVDGSITVSYTKENSFVVHSADVELEDDDGDDAGDITFSGSAAFCKDADGDFEDALGD